MTGNSDDIALARTEQEQRQTKVTRMILDLAEAGYVTAARDPRGNPERDPDGAPVWRITEAGEAYLAQQQSEPEQSEQEPEQQQSERQVQS